MRVEGNDDRFAVELFGPAFHPVKEGLVAAMDAVEVSDCDSRVVEWSPDSIDTLDNFHRTEHVLPKNLETP